MLKPKSNPENEARQSCTSFTSRHDTPFQQALHKHTHEVFLNIMMYDPEVVKATLVKVLALVPSEQFDDREREHLYAVWQYFHEVNVC